jgi:hypothetical protein
MLSSDPLGMHHHYHHDRDLSCSQPWVCAIKEGFLSYSFNPFSVPAVRSM